MNTIAANAARDYAALDDAALVACVLAGERDAFRQIMQRCNQRMFRVVRGVIRNEAEAEDVVQEAYVHAYEKIASFRGESSLATWLTRIALNEAYGRLRRRRETVDIEQLEQASATSAQVESTSVERWIADISLSSATPSGELKTAVPGWYCNAT